MSDIFVLTKTDKAMYNCYGEPPPVTEIVGWTTDISVMRDWRKKSHRDVEYDFKLVEEYAPMRKGADGDAEAAIAYCKLEAEGKVNHGAMA